MSAALGKYAHPRPIRAAARVASAILDVGRGHLMEHENDFDVAERVEPRERRGLETVGVELYRGALLSPTIVLGALASGRDAANRSEVKAHVRDPGFRPDETKECTDSRAAPIPPSHAARNVVRHSDR